MKPRVNAKLRGAIGAIGLALCSSLAMAGPAAPVATRVVSYSELNLSSPQGVATLYRRISRAADEVCGPAEQTGSHVPPRAYRECVARAVNEAIQAVNRPELSAYHAQKQHLPRLPGDVIASR
jgi:UrcA family protein